MSDVSGTVGMVLDPDSVPPGFTMDIEDGTIIQESWLWWSPTRKRWEPTLYAGVAYDKSIDENCYCKPIGDLYDLYPAIEIIEGCCRRLRETLMVMQAEKQKGKR